MFGFGKKKVDADEKKRQEEEAKRLREEEAEAKRAEQIEKLLPWELEQRVASFLNPIKIPFIIVVGILGWVMEAKVAAISNGAYQRSFFQSGAQCFIHKADYNQLKLNDPRLNNIAERLNDIFRPAIESINNTFTNLTHCYEEDNETVCDVLNTGYNLSFDKDWCGLVLDHEKHECSEPTKDTHFILTEDEHPGIEWRIPFVPYVLVWMIFKLVFLPVHVVDRIANKLAGNPQPMPEPIFKLLTEPHCNPDNGGCGKACSMLRPASIVCKVIRFSLLPNSLILPLVSMRSMKECPNYLVYTQDASFAWIIYIWLVIDFVSIVGLYALGKTVFGGHAISKLWYRLWKICYFPTTIAALTLFIMDVIAVFNWRFWQGLEIFLRISFQLNLGFDFTLDVTQSLANTVIILDALQLTVMILSFVCPKLLGRVPLPDWIREWTDRPDDTLNKNAATAGTDSAALAEGESQGLLTGEESRPAASSGADPEQPPAQPSEAADTGTASAGTKSRGGIFGKIPGFNR